MSQPRGYSNTKRPVPRRNTAPTQANPHVKRRKKKKSKAPIVFTLVFILLIIAAAVYFILPDLLNKDKQGESKPTPTVTATAGSNVLSEYMSNQPQDNNNDNLDKSFENSINVDNLSVYEGLDPNWHNILLLGSDVRVLTETSRTDTMIICSINNKTGEVKLSSIMRDTAISIPGHGTQRMNSAFFYGGPELAVKTVNELFNMNIEHYVLVDFNGFANIAEAMGGITMDITKSELDQINHNVAEQYLGLVNQGKMEYDAAEREFWKIVLTDAGNGIHLNGMQTLGYARIRKIDSDFARVERQQKVLNKLMEKSKGLGALEIFNLLTQCKDYFKTNISILDIASTAELVLNRKDFSQAQTMRLPVLGTYKEEKRNDIAMLYDMDLDANRIKLHGFIYQ